MSDFTTPMPPAASAAEAITARRAALGLLGLESATPLPAWVILNAIRNQNFSGEVTLFTLPAVRVWAIDGHIYWAERPGAPAAVDRLVELGALTAEQARLGTVRLGDVIHLGRLFDRMPGLDHDDLLRALDFVRDSITAEVADLLTERVDVVPHRHHVSGMVFWFEADHVVPAPQPSATPAAVVVTPPTPQEPLPVVAVEPPPSVSAPPSVTAPLSVAAPPSTEPPVAEPPSTEVVLAVRSVLDEIRAALGRGGGESVRPIPDPTPTPGTGPSASPSPTLDLPFQSLLETAPMSIPTRNADAPPAMAPTSPAVAPPSAPTDARPGDLDQQELAPRELHLQDLDQQDLDQQDDAEMDPLGPIGPAAPRRAQRTPPATYSAPVEYEPAPAPVVSIAEASQQPAGGLRRLIGGRRR